MPRFISIVEFVSARIFIGVNKCPARKHHIALNVLWRAESNGYIYTSYILRSVGLAS
jgi:hypothetical protein